MILILLVVFCMAVGAETYQGWSQGLLVGEPVGVNVMYWATPHFLINFNGASSFLMMLPRENKSELTPNLMFDVDFLLNYSAPFSARLFDFSIYLETSFYMGLGVRMIVDFNNLSVYPGFRFPMGIGFLPVKDGPVYLHLGGSFIYGLKEDAKAMAISICLGIQFLLDQEPKAGSTTSPLS